MRWFGQTFSRSREGFGAVVFRMEGFGGTFFLDVSTGEGDAFVEECEEEWEKGEELLDVRVVGRASGRDCWGFLVEVQMCFPS